MRRVYAWMGLAGLGSELIVHAVDTLGRLDASRNDHDEHDA